MFFSLPSWLDSSQNALCHRLLEPSVGTADFGLSHGVGALPSLAMVRIHLPLDVGAGVGSDP